MANGFHDSSPIEVNPEKLLLAVTFLEESGAFLDEICWTPLRDLQVFWKRIFGLIFGSGHHSDIIVSAASFLISSAYGVFSVTNSRIDKDLSDVLKNENELNPLLNDFLEEKGLYDIQILDGAKNTDKIEGRFKYSYRGKLADWLQESRHFTLPHIVRDLSASQEIASIPQLSDDLKESELNELKEWLYSEFISEEKKDLNKPLHEVLTEILNKAKNASKEERNLLNEHLKSKGLSLEKISSFRRILPLFYDVDKKTYNLEITIAESQERFLKKLNKISPSDVLKGSYDFVGDVSFNFWLSFFVFDLFQNKADTSEWKLSDQFISLGIPLGIAATKIALKFFHFFKKRSANLQEKQRLIDMQISSCISELGCANASEFEHQILKYIFIRQKVKSYSSVPLSVKMDNGILDEVEKILSSADIEISSNSNKSVSARIKTIENYIYSDNNNRFTRFSACVSEIASRAIQFSFIQWLCGVVIYAICKAAKAHTALKVAVIFGGNLVSLGAFLVGMTIGGIIYGCKVKKQIEEKKQRLKEKYESCKPKLDQLQKLELQNEKLVKLITKIDPTYTLPTLLKPHHDDTFTQLKVLNEDSWAETIKKIPSYLKVIIAKMGSGIFIYRSSIALGISVLSSMSLLAVSWPLACVAIGLGAVWAGIFLYRFIQERKLDAAERLLNDVDNRLYVADKNQGKILSELRHLKCQENIDSAKNSNNASTQVFFEEKRNRQNLTFACSVTADLH